MLNYKSDKLITKTLARKTAFGVDSAGGVRGKPYCWEPVFKKSKSVGSLAREHRGAGGAWQANHC